MRGAQFLLAMRARRSRRAFSISLRYSESTTTGNAIVNGVTEFDFSGKNETRVAVVRVRFCMEMEMDKWKGMGGWLILPMKSNHVFC